MVKSQHARAREQNLNNSQSSKYPICLIVSSTDFTKRKSVYRSLGILLHMFVGGKSCKKHFVALEGAAQSLLNRPQVMSLESASVRSEDFKREKNLGVWS